MHNKSIIKRLWEQKEIQLMVIPGIIFFIIFAYVPMYGLVIAFREYRVGEPFLSFGPEARWVGLKHFRDFIKDPAFINIMRNTLVISVLRLAVAFPISIIFAILLNEVQGSRFKKAIQSVSYLPHFVSWAIVSGLVLQMLSINGGVNNILLNLKIIDKPIMFMAKSNYFWFVLVGSDIWKETGWTSIIYLGAMSSINPELYQVASIDGANRWQRIRHITLPGISSSIVIVFILTIASLFSYGFEPIIQLTNNLSNTMVMKTAEIVDTHVLRMGIQLGQYSYATAVGLFRSVLSVVLLLISNTVCRKTTGSSLW